MSRKRFHFSGIAIGFAIALFTLSILPNRAWAETEYEGKAKWLKAFALWTTWRDDDFSGKDAPFVFGILGDNPFGERIELLKSHPIHRRKVQVKFFKNVEDVAGCQILFISSSEKRSLAKTLKTLKSQRILTVSDIDGFIEKGGIASVVVKQTGVVVSTPIPDINKEAVTQDGWDFNPQLLATIKKIQDQNK